jgi:hypothetical protein
VAMLSSSILNGLSSSAYRVISHCGKMLTRSSSQLSGTPVKKQLRLLKLKLSKGE